MQKLYIMLGLSTISFSLSGMEQPDHVITAIVEPLPQHCSVNSDTQEKFVHIKRPVKFKDIEGNEIISCNVPLFYAALQTHAPKSAPRTLFTKGQPYTVIRTDVRSKPNKTYEFKLEAHRIYPENHFHDNY